MGRYAAQQADCGSLERYLDSMTQQVNSLELELRRLAKERQDREALNEEHARRASRQPSASGKQLEAELAQVSADCEQLETLLQQCFLRPRRYSRASWDPPTSPPRYARPRPRASGASSSRATPPRRQASSRPPPPPPPPAEEAGEAVGDGDDGDGDGDSDAGRAAPQSRAPRAGAAGGGSGGPRILSSPSGILQEVLDEMRLPHNAGRTRLLDDALVKVEHELLAVHDATRNFRPILDYLSHPHKEHSRPPARRPTHMGRQSGRPRSQKCALGVQATRAGGREEAARGGDA